MSNIKIVAIVGSLREGSFNRVLAAAAASSLPAAAEMEFLDYGDVPFMNQDIEFPAPDPVTRVRRAVEEADAVWIFTPEYNYGLPAPLKNALDWLSRPLAAGDYATPRPLTGKPVAIAGAGGRNAAAGARKAASDLLTYLGARLVGGEGKGFVLPGAAWSEGVYEPDAEDLRRIGAQGEALIAAL